MPCGDLSIAFEHKVFNPSTGAPCAGTRGYGRFSKG